MMIIFSYSLLIVLYMISLLIPSTTLSYCIGILAFLAVLVSFRRATGLYFISGTCFLVIGTGLFIYNDLPFYTFVLNFQSMLGMLSLFFVLPFINSIIRIGQYDKNLSLLLQQKITDLGILYRRSFIVTHFLALFLNIATIPLMVNSLTRVLQQIPEKTREKFFSQNLLRAYALCLAWSPFEIMVIMSLDLTGYSYYRFLPLMIAILVIIISSDWLLSYFKYKSTSLTYSYKSEKAPKQMYKKMLQMLLMLLAFIGLTTILQNTLDKGFLFSVVVSIIPLSVTWALIIGKIKRYFTYSIPHWKVRTNGLANYFYLFLSAGLFVQMLSISNFLSFLQFLFAAVSNEALFFYLIIAAFFLITSFIGFHPIVSFTILIELINPVLDQVSSLSLTIVLVTCSLSTVMYSPYNISLSILSEQIHINPYKVGVKNIVFAICYMLLSILIAYLLTFLL